MSGHRRIRFFLGLIAWAFAFYAAGRSVMTVQARASRPAEFVVLQLDPTMTLEPGDIVYLASDAGLEQIGEVNAPPSEDGLVPLAVDPVAFRSLNASTEATVWSTPLSAEDALAALLPPTIQHRAAEIILSDWRLHQQALAEAWGPLAADLAIAFVQTVYPDVEAAVQKREGEIVAVLSRHGESLREIWPEIEARISPIVAEYLTPVLARLLENALAEVPKMRIVWQVARGHHAMAFRLLLDWVADYLTNIPEPDRAALGEAVETTLNRISEDPIVVDRFTEWGSQIVHDEALAAILLNIYREAVTENPHTAQFLREEIMDSPRVRRHFYELIELFGPTARRVAAACLFDEQGTTRPEIVHLTRSIALDRKVSWVTLRTADPGAEPLLPANILPAIRGGTAR
ncbi:MAG: hypothetical protein J5J06_14690 [Phycisphaerae bacterium]|nr:hypothetical protein [Phycisphaerae bacterium]